MARTAYYFITPDRLEPVGGIKVIYQFVSLLNAVGHEAYVVHIERKFGRKHDLQFPNLRFVYLEEKRFFGATEVVFVPESDVKLMNAMRTMPARKIVFNQNWANTFGQFRELADENIAKYQDLGINEVLCVSERIMDYLAFAMNHPGNALDIGVVHPYLSDAFVAKKLVNKTHRIAFMPRKNTRVFQDIFSTLFAKDKRVEWIHIDAMTEDQVAAILHESTIFLALGYPEGFSLPPLEAMKCGCLVIGYSGYGGLEYMHCERDERGMAIAGQTNMLLHPDGDVVGLAQELHRVWIDLALGGASGHYQLIADAGIATAARFTQTRSEAMLIDYVRRLEAVSGAAPGVPSPT